MILNAINGDATAAIQAAEDAAASAGEALIWNAGTYSINPTGITKRNVTWMASGPVTLKAAAGAWTKPLVSGSDLTGFGILGIGFDTSEMAGATIYTPALSLTNCTAWRMRSCSFTGIQVFGIAVDAGSDFTIQDCSFVKPNPAPTQNEAINVSTAAGSVTRAEIIDNDCIGCGMDISAAFSTISRNSVFGWQFGAGITTEQSPDCAQLMIAENMCIGGVGTDVNSTVVSGIENWAPRSTISGNICAANSGSGIDSGGMNSVVANNVCFNNGQTNHGPGICTRWGSAAYNGSYSLVSGNECFDTQTTRTQGYGYTDQSADVTDITLTGNKFFNGAVGPMSALGQRTDFRGPRLCGSVAYAAQSLPNGNSAGGSFGVPGAAMGDLVCVAHTADTQGCKLFGWVSGPNTVGFRIENNVGEAITIPAGTVNMLIEKPLNYAAF